MTTDTKAGVSEYAHMLLKVADIDRSRSFYKDLLGFTPRNAHPDTAETKVERKETEGVFVLKDGYAKFVSTLAPAWAADKRPCTAGSSGSTAKVLFRSRARRITWRGPVDKRR